MFGVRLPAKRFTLLLLVEEEEDYVADFVATCTWPAAVPGNVQQTRSIPGSLRLCSRSLFFDPDDVRIPIVRCVLANGELHGNTPTKSHQPLKLTAGYPSCLYNSLKASARAVFPWQQPKSSR